MPKVKAPVVLQRSPLQLYLPNGGWLDFWIKNADAIRQYVSENKLTPVSSAALPGFVGGLQMAQAIAMPESSASQRFVDLGIRGGLRIPHLHLDGKIYKLTDQQWASFSARILGDARAKLAKVNSISFDHGMNLAQATEMLG
jgi:hypothetical protein